MTSHPLLPLAKHFRSYVTSQWIPKAYTGDVGSWGRGAILRVWPRGEDADHIKCTIAMVHDMAFCSDHERGIREIDLADPRSFEKVLEWMILVGVARVDSVWVDP